MLRPYEVPDYESGLIKSEFVSFLGLRVPIVSAENNPRATASAQTGDRGFGVSLVYH
ncbi:MAG: hypothetical protein WBA99_15750 [Nodosilinea sp.]